ncbi:MAG: DUF4169 family protein [Hyphomicrobiaceae bacterium]|nr:DUF4169 family protein [Hyphomicrobiaceae bacterium]
MSAEIINLRRARKAREKARAAETAAENRARHGRSKHDSERGTVEEHQRAAHLDGHLRVALFEAPGTPAAAEPMPAPVAANEDAATPAPAPQVSRGEAMEDDDGFGPGSAS